MRIRPTSAAGSQLDSMTLATKQTLTNMATILARHAKGLRGLVGLDFRLDGDNVWLTEVNPRYTASVELLELATGRSLLNLTETKSSLEIPPNREQTASSNPPSAFEETTPKTHEPIVIKQILYASKSWTAVDFRRWVNVRDPWVIPFVADIPPAGVCIEAGWPICTVMASGSDRKNAEATLQHRLRLIRELLQSTP